MDREWGGGVVTLDLEMGPMQVNLQDERTLGWFLLAFPRGHLLGRRLDGPGLDTLSLDVDKVAPGPHTLHLNTLAQQPSCSLGPQ